MDAGLPRQAGPLATEAIGNGMQSAGPCNRAMLVISANQALLHFITSVLMTVSLLAWSAYLSSGLEPGCLT